MDATENSQRLWATPISSFERTSQQHLIAIARESIEETLTRGAPAPWTFSPAPELDILRASFVTLYTHGELHGCCGTLEAERPLAMDVWLNAQAAAFGDPRFPRLTDADWPHTHVHISILSPLEPVAAESEAELLHMLRPGVDGLLLESGWQRATFLPSVWEQLPNPREFLSHLKLKAGWRADYWSAQMRVYRYTTESFGERDE